MKSNAKTVFDRADSVYEVPHLMNGHRRTMYRFGSLIIELSSTPVSPDWRTAPANLWYERGLIPRPLKQSLFCETYFMESGKCWGWYNPTQIRRGTKMQIRFGEFDYEDTPENRAAIIEAALNMMEYDIRVLEEE